MRPALRTVAATAAVTLLAVLLVAGGGLLALATRPYDFERVVALGDRPAWTATVTYRPAEPWVDVEARLDGLRRYRDVAFRVEAPEPWAPRWEGRLQGELSEFVTLRDAARPPVPLALAAAQALAAGYRVVLTVDGEPLTVAFEGFAPPRPRPACWRRGGTGCAPRSGSGAALPPPRRRRVRGRNPSRLCTKCPATVWLTSC